MTRWLILTVALLTLGVSTPGWADDWGDCLQQADPDLGAWACTNIINSGKASGENLSYAYYGRGNAYYAKGDYDRAIVDLDKAIQLKPDLAEAYVDRGLAYKGKGNYDRAIVDYDKAIQLKPDLAYAYGNRGLAYDGKGDYDRAIVDLDKAIQLKPDLAEAYSGRGRAYNDRGYAYVRKGDYDRAIADYDKAIQLKPDYAYAYYGRGNAHDDQGDPAKALIDFRVAARLIPASDPWNARVLARIAEIEKKLAPKPKVETAASSSAEPLLVPVQLPRLRPSSLRDPIEPTIHRK